MVVGSLGLAAAACVPEVTVPEVERTWVRLAEPTDLTYTSANVKLRGVSLESCNGGADWVGLDIDLDLLDPEPQQIFGGDWCGVLLDLDLFTINGLGADGGTFSLYIDAPDVRLSASRTVIEDESLVLEFAFDGWVHPDMVGIVDTENVLVDVAHASHDRVSDALRLGSALFADSTPDGVIDRFERDALPIAIGPSHPRSVDPSPRFVAVGERGRWVSTVDGVIWDLDDSDIDETEALKAVIRTWDRWVAVGGEAGARSMSSADLGDFAEGGGGGKFNDVVFGDGRLVAVGAEGRRSWSYDGVVWRDVAAISFVDFNAVTWGDGRFVAVGSDGGRSESVDGMTWSDTDVGGETLHDIAWGNNQFVAVGDNARRLTSADGRVWDLDLAGGDPIYGVVWSDDTFFATGSGVSFWSTDGLTWTAGAVKAPEAKTPELTSIAYGNGVYVGLGPAGRHKSTDGSTWDVTVAADDLMLFGVNYAE